MENNMILKSRIRVKFCKISTRKTDTTKELKIVYSAIQYLLILSLQL